MGIKIFITKNKCLKTMEKGLKHSHRIVQQETGLYTQNPVIRQLGKG